MAILVIIPFFCLCFSIIRKKQWLKIQISLSFNHCLLILHLERMSKTLT